VFANHLVLVKKKALLGVKPKRLKGKDVGFKATINYLFVIVAGLLLNSAQKTLNHQ
jgi:hypothetical protein